MEVESLNSEEIASTLICSFCHGTKVICVGTPDDCANRPNDKDKCLGCEFARPCSCYYGG